MMPLFYFPKHEDVVFRHRDDSTAMSKLPTFTLRRDLNSAAAVAGGTVAQRSDKTFPSEDDSTIRDRFWACPALPTDFGYCECGGSTVESAMHRHGLQDEFLYNLSPPPITAFGNPGHVFDYVIDDSNFQVVMDTGTEAPLQRGVGIQRDEDGGGEQRPLDPDYFFSSETVQRCPLVGGERAPVVTSACHVMPVVGGGSWAEETKALTSEYCERDVTRNATSADQLKESDGQGETPSPKDNNLSLKLKATSCINH